MDNYQGDLTDILRASSGGGALGQSDGLGPGPVSNWEFSCDLTNLSSASALENNNNINREDTNSNIFGDPFINMRDPLLHGCSSYFINTTTTTTTTRNSVDDTCNILGDNHHQNKVFEEEMNNTNNNNSPCNIFSRIQISQNNNNSSSATKLPVDSPVIASPRRFKASIDMINVNTSKNCLIDNTGPVQISSPRNLGIKRRKSQAKKVVCIPAPAAANSRPSGEVVPSDLWAWRKYGQKPIKGSPYPRGYYRCSSSKGCSARKQVERSRTDPNMLVITYTSEHNHPWPTQRNALAGSTRTQPPKHNATSSKTSSTSHQPQKNPINTKEEHNTKESSNGALSPIGASVKEEIEDVNEKKMIEMEMEMEIDDDQLNSSYRPTMPQSEDFFAELGEIEADPLDLLFSQGGFSGDHEQKGSKGLDPFGLFDWSGENNNNISFEESKRGL